MSSDPGRRETSGRGTARGAGDLAARRRLGLLVFGAAFVVLFAVVAIAEGVGDPSIPSGDVVLVDGAPGEIGEITEEEFEHALEQTGGKVAKPGTAKYEEQKESTINSLLEGVWLQGLADEWGIEVTEKEITKELNKIKKESFQSEAEFRDFAEKANFTKQDIRERVKLQILSAKLQEELQGKAPAPTQREIENYYEAAKDTQFTQPATRDVRWIVNKSRKKAKEARVQLGKDNSTDNWNKVAKELSEDPATKNNGGLQEAVQEGTLEEPLDEAVFNAPEGVIDGPIKSQRGWNVFEVTNSNPETTQELKAVEGQIESTLAQTIEQEYFNSFLSSFTYTWTGRTFCADDYVTERCANYRGNGHSATAPEACYEADPKGGRPEACPAPVNQLVPALPGSVTPLEPKGKPLAQRPRPKEEEGGEAASGLEGLPEGAVPPPSQGAPPAGE